MSHRIVVLLLASGIAHAADVSLREAYRSALAKTEGAAIGRARVDQADARIDQLQSRFLPTLSFESSFQRLDQTSDRTSRYSRLTATQPLYAGGADAAAMRAGRANREAAAKQAVALQHDIYRDVAHTFYEVLAHQRDVDTLKTMISLASDRVKEIGERAKIGRSRNVDLLAARAQIAVLQAQLSADEGDLSTARDEFLLLTGLEETTSLKETLEVPPAPASVATYLNRLDERPEIAALRSQEDAANGAADVASAAHLPSLDLNGHYYLDRTGSQAENAWDVGLGLSVPLFSGGLVSAEVREARLKAEEAKLLLNQARRRGEIEIRTAHNSVGAALRQIESLKSALESTEQNYKEQSKNYRFGQATNLDVIQALNSYQDTKRTLDRTRYAALSAWADLKAATAAAPTEMSEGDAR